MGQMMEPTGINSLQPNRARWRELKAQLLETFGSELRGKKVVYLDYPLHLNLGDLLIYKGTLTLLEELGAQVEMSFSTSNADRFFRTRIPEDRVLLLHGGGNFGDIYSIHQALREKVIKQFPNNPILIMPQSVHFNEPEKFLQNCALYREHKNLKMYVRDQESFNFMAQALAPEQLFMAPDLATMLIDEWTWPQQMPERTLMFRRKDCESVSSAAAADAFDWNSLYTSMDMKKFRLFNRVSGLERKHDVNLFTSPLWVRFSDALINKAVNFYQSYGQVDTDRLHGAILALLLGRPVLLSDNCYNKIDRYVRCWLV
ncbi:MULTISPECIES: polysaccharide pyruvyl transferase family protein [unclassified Hahella]|uniref:polysaccharide pyruvyl transferase family protein n=1 Tax=unclassified Hahella TaxID=2624107 RepID=UPI001C1EACF6|nr:MULTISPECIES: polysaccharide pyruvyl transferase family protein [unclassified Hahella]MBU6952257.1 polysaccharide pyruvyl transferase family protein [Hahella sp. HN01]MDG9667605.1 polysaccharide pyruvyl transferase family protein [Hahella sp. CR1]